MTMLDGFVDEKIMEDGFAFSESGIYKTVETGNRSYYLDIVKEWPINSAPEVFGLHSNADITCARSVMLLLPVWDGGVASTVARRILQFHLLIGSDTFAVVAQVWEFGYCLPHYCAPPSFYMPPHCLLQE